MVYTFRKHERQKVIGAFMPWRTKSVEELREQFFARYKESGNMSKTCREFEITRNTGYKWLTRCTNGESLSNRSRKPNRNANKTDAITEALILSIRKENPSWGGRLIYDYLNKQGHLFLPSARTCCNILSRNGCIHQEESLKHIAYKRFVRKECNELWQTDFKGDFLLLDNNRCYPLTILDDHSRFSIMIECKLDTKNVTNNFRDAFYGYGLPDSLLSDNCLQFAGFRGGYTRFERWLMEHNVLPIHGRAYHPQTQGKIERFHRTMKSELLRNRQFKNINDIQAKMDEWRHKYNNDRPHLALNAKCPSEIYVPSKREYSDIVSDYIYDGKVRKVNNWGYLRFADFQIYLSETMSDTILEIKENTNGNTFDIFFRNFKIAEIDPVKGKLVNRKISRRT